MQTDWDLRAADARRYVDSFNWIDDLEWNEAAQRDVKLLLQGLDGMSFSDMSVLDLGCGVGRLDKYLKEIFREVHGVDVSSGMIEIARHNLRGAPNVRFEKNNGFDLSIYPESSFDLVLSYIVLQHLPRQIVRGYLREAFRVLKPGGIFRFQLATRDFMNALLSLMSRGRNGRFDLRIGLEPSNWNSWTVRLYTESEIERLASLNTFRILDVRRVNLQRRVRPTLPPGLFQQPLTTMVWYWVLYKFFSNSSQLFVTLQKPA